MSIDRPSHTLDSLLFESGYQIKNFFILGYPCVLVVSFALSYIFLAAELKYRCLIPECEPVANTSYLTPWLKHAVPYNTDGYPQTCYRYNQALGVSGCSPVSFNTSDVIKCNKWVFETDEVNLLNEFNLECDENRWKLTIIGSLDGLGALIGSPICAIISDKYGRKFALWIFSSLCIILGLIRSFSINYYMYTILDFCNAFLDFGIFGTAFVLCMELVSSRHRVSGNIILNLFCCSGYVLLGAIGIWIHDWKWVLRVLYGSGTVLFFYCWITPESMRWLCIKNRHSEAAEVASKILKNHPQIQNVDLRSIMLVEKELDAKELNLGYMTTLRLTLSSSKLSLRLVHSSLCWIGIVFLWYGIVQQSVSLSGDKHVNFIYSALAQVPGYLATSLSVKVGQRPTLIVSLFVCAGVCQLFFFLPSEYIMLRQALFLLGITGITSAYTVLYVNTVEMFPTPLRQSLLAFCSMIGRIGQVIAPQVMFLLGAEWPLLLFGLVALSVAALAFFLPETINLELPDTVYQAENVGLDPTSRS